MKILVCVDPSDGSLELWQRGYDGWYREEELFVFEYLGSPSSLPHYGAWEAWFAAGPEENGREILGEL